MAEEVSPEMEKFQPLNNTHLQAIIPTSTDLLSMQPTAAFVTIQTFDIITPNPQLLPLYPNHYLPPIHPLLLSHALTSTLS